jgi:hypothetical protein
LALESLLFRPFQDVTLFRPQRMVLGQLLLIIPGHPSRGVGCQFGGVVLQLAEVVEGIDARQFARVDQAHKKVAYLRAMQRAIEQRVLAMQHGAFERALAKVIGEGRQLHRMTTMPIRFLKLSTHTIR